MIEVEDVTHRYGDRTVLRDVTVTLTERRVGIIGANGSGKSSFARLLNGLLTPSEGRVRVAGHDTVTEGPAVRRMVGFVFQNPDAQIVLPTVAEDVGFSLRGRGLTPDEVERRVTVTLERHGLQGYRDHPAHLLSGGQKQLLALCSAIVGEPTYLVLDEPTTLLDRRNARRIGETIADLPQQVLLVTHDLDLVRRCSRVLLFDEGRIVCDAAPDEAVATYLDLVR